MKKKIKFKNKGQELLNKAKKIIPGGGQLLSKRSELFLPELWPVYYKKAKGVAIWDLNNKKYFDFAGMGTLSCILGYSDSYVNKKVINAINNSSMGTLNSYEEVEFSELLLEAHSWADMTRFARSGGEACSIAIRIARAASGKDKVLFCGYHGWQDWYLSSNLRKKDNLTDQLLPGLIPNGVPKNLIDSAIPFKYNDKEDFDKKVNKHNKNIGAIIMEPQRNMKPDVKLLRHIKSIAKKIGAVFIFDEITSGFHDNYGGKHLFYKINPDIAIYSKAIGNGFPIAAILGRKDVMQYAQNTFISSLMWTERVGFVAGIATLTKMKKFNVQKINTNYGKFIKKRWQEIANSNDIKITIKGMDTIPEFSFCYKNSLELSTYFNQEMLHKGFLTSSRLATSFSHNYKIIENYLDACYETFKKISKIINSKSKVPLQGPIRHDTFKRLN